MSQYSFRIRTIFTSIPSRFLSVELVDLFSITDFVSISNKNLTATLEPIAGIGEAHIQNCQVTRLVNVASPARHNLYRYADLGHSFAKYAPIQMICCFHSNQNGSIVVKIVAHWLTASVITSRGPSLSLAKTRVKNVPNASGYVKIDCVMHRVMKHLNNQHVPCTKQRRAIKTRQLSTLV